MDMFTDADDKTGYFMDLLLETCKQFIPYKCVTINPKDMPWMTADINHKMHIRNKPHKRWKSSGSATQYEQFKVKKAETNVAMQLAKTSHFEHIKDKLCNPEVGKREYWHLLKSIYGCKILIHIF